MSCDYPISCQTGAGTGLGEVGGGWRGAFKLLLETLACQPTANFEKGVWGSPWAVHTSLALGWAGILKQASHSMLHLKLFNGEPINMVYTSFETTLCSHFSLTKPL